MATSSSGSSLMPSSFRTSWRGLLHDAGARIVVLVDPVAEAHQAERIVLVLRLGDVMRNAIGRADLLQHLQRRLVGAAMGGAPQAGDAGRDAGERVGARRAGKTHGRGRGVLLVIGVQDEDPVERPREHRVDLVFLARHREAHAQEVRRVVEVVLRIHEGLADRVLVGHGGERRHLGDHAHGGDHALVRIRDVGRVVIEGRRARRREATMMAIGCASRRKPVKKRFIWSCTMVWRVTR